MATTDSTPWTTRGLGIVTEDNLLQQPLYDLAYILETILQVSGIDPSFKKRTSQQNKLVFLAYPETNPLYPYIVIERTAMDVDPIGKDHVTVHCDYQIKLIGQKPATLTALGQQLFKALKNARETLHDYNVHYDPISFLKTFQPARPDPDLPKTYFQVQVYSFFHIVK